MAVVLDPDIKRGKLRTWLTASQSEFAIPSVEAIDEGVISIPADLPQEFGYISSNPLLGLFFEDVEVFVDGATTRARFVLNVFWKQRRPRDEAKGAEWVRTGQIG